MEGDSLEETLGIKLPVGSVPAKVAMEIKKLTGIAPSEVQRIAANNAYLILCDYVDEEGLALINKVKRMLKKNGIEARLFEDGEETTSELLDNLEELNKEIAEECDEYPD